MGRNLAEPLCTIVMFSIYVNSRPFIYLNGFLLYRQRRGCKKLDEKSIMNNLTCSEAISLL